MRRPRGWTIGTVGLLVLLAAAPAFGKAAGKKRTKAKTTITASSKSSSSASTKKARKSRVETLTFDAQHVEGRLRSPQILYFLRRVRAQFAPRPLGHRSFLLELGDTRRSSALR